MLRREVVRLACNAKVKQELAENVKQYLENEVPWGIVAGQCDNSYRLARKAKQSGEKVEQPLEF